MVKLSKQEYASRLGISPEVQDLRKSLQDMIGTSIGVPSDGQVVEVLGMEETQDLRYQVRVKVLEEMN